MRHKIFLILPLLSLLAEPSPVISIHAMGDMVPGTNFQGRTLPANPGEAFFSGAREYIRGADIIFGNFESTLTDYPTSSKNTSKKLVFAFRTPPSMARILAKEGYNVLSIANNHSFDFTEAGFRDTHKNLTAAGILAPGRKGEIDYLNVKGIKTAWIGFSYSARHNDMKDLPGVAEIVREAAKNAQLVFVSVHAGAEGGDAMEVRDRTEMFHGENRGNIVAFARVAIDAGADMVIGHGPHVVRAMDIYKGRLIAYSLGNFLGYNALSARGVAGTSLILRAELAADGSFQKGRIIPMRMNSSAIPEYDSSGEAIRIIKSRTAADFPRSRLVISSDGQLSLRD